MKQKYKHINFREPEKIRIMKEAVVILDEFMAQEYTLTIRQLYYQLVSRNLIENTQNNYKNLSSYMSDARMCGLADWDAIEDRTRAPLQPPYSENMREALRSLQERYRMDRQEGQPFRVEIWSEKDALSSILLDVSVPHGIMLRINKGWDSTTSVRGAAVQLQRDGRPIKILYLGDHDPSGLEMIRSLKKRLSILGVCDFEFIVVGLTQEQIKTHELPPYPVKVSDSRSPAYVREFGPVAWEVDGLTPKQIKGYLTEALDPILDRSELQSVIDQEDGDKDILSEIIEGL